MHKNGFQFYARMNPWADSVDLNIAMADPAFPGKVGHMVPPVFKFEEPGHFAEATMKMPREAAQKLMDEFWNLGIRPTSEASIGNKGHIAAMEAHLSDLRRVIFKDPIPEGTGKW